MAKKEPGVRARKRREDLIATASKVRELGGMPAVRKKLEQFKKLAEELKPFGHTPWLVESRLYEIQEIADAIQPPKE